MSLYTYNETGLAKITKHRNWALTVNNYTKTAKEIIEKVFLPTNKSTPFYKVLHQLDIPNDFKEIEKLAKKIRGQFNDVVIIGMGGATLNPQSVLALQFKKETKVQLHFIYNTDPLIYAKLKTSLDLKKTAFLIISSSGKTLETISITAAFLNEYKEHKELNKHFYFVIGSQESPLRTLANKIKATILNHTDEISGRYASFTNITTLPGLIAGLEMQNFLEGSISTLKEFWKKKEESLPVKSAITLLAAKKNILVNIGYLQAFFPFMEWYCQITAESLGKKGLGFTPTKGIGPNDQHSMFQLYLDGPQDKLITFFYSKNIPQESNQAKLLKKNIPSYLVNKTLKHINDIEFYSTQSTLINRQVPFRTLVLENLTEKALGALMAHCMIEVIMLGHLLNINPFDQPSVEEIKVIAQNLLQSK